MQTRRLWAVICLTVLMGPLVGSLTVPPSDYVRLDNEVQILPEGQTLTIPEQDGWGWIVDERPWWERSALDLDRNKIHDSLQDSIFMTGIGLSYGTEVNDAHIADLNDMGLEVVDVIESVDAVLLGIINTSIVESLAQLDDVVMVERYGEIHLYGDIQTPAVKARNSTLYPGAWDLGVTGDGVVIAMVDTGVDNEHPGLNEKFVAGYDAVCFVHTDPTCVLAGGRVEDGSYDPDDGNQHGTACMGMAAATGIDANGEQTDFYGAAPDAALVDVRIGTDAGAGPFENYLLSQEFYESAMNGIQWIINHKDDAWAGAEESEYGIDIISLSWGITSHEAGGSDGSDMHSRILDEAMIAGVVVSVAAGNDGPDNDGLSGMGSSDLSVTVGATDDQNTVDREDDTIAGYSSRGPRRDNGDGNPLNELKPEVTAPGTNIIQAEGCVSSGGCNNFIGGDASSNGYTGRGSGTSYATPAVSGIMAMMIEANPDLSPAEIKEILKLTAERRGEPSNPDVDPFWNRDFGFGMVDAYAAVSMAFDLKYQGLTGEVDVTTQVHIMDTNTSDGIATLKGLAWGQVSAVSSVEYRIDGGEWMSATFDEGAETLGAFARFNWTVALDTSKLMEGNRSIEIRAVNSEGVQSLMVATTVYGTWDGSTEGEEFGFQELVMAGLALALLVLALIILLGGDGDEYESKNATYVPPTLAEQEVLDAIIESDSGGDGDG
ncbi:MAG: S8 family serine peptidase [Candidatus Thermoplasmatota archaeon]|nr:S8 family serine peptidase [Candidatus Thermoplasmatota archaeon]MEC8610115.1 S8 family serine peptidase [Candidatus Thermoplasmatota archaeon]